MERASRDLASIKPSKQANSDSVALSRYLIAIGLHMTPDRLDDLLALLAVLMIEAGGSLSLAIGMALQEPARGPAEAPKGADVQTPPARQRHLWTLAWTPSARQPTPILPDGCAARAAECIPRCGAWLESLGARQPECT